MRSRAAPHNFQHGTPRALPRQSQSAVSSGDAEHGQAERSVVLGLAQHLLVEGADKLRIGAQNQGLQFVLDHRRQRVGGAGDAPKAAVAAAVHTVIGDKGYLHRPRPRQHLQGVADRLGLGRGVLDADLDLGDLHVPRSLVGSTGASAGRACIWSSVW